MRTHTQQPITKPVPATKPAGSARKPRRSSEKAAVGSQQWELALHPKVRQFLNAAGKLDWSELP
jgi:hypothetical protein